MSLCYKDITYCADTKECSNMDCMRRLIDEDIQKASKLGLCISQAHWKNVCMFFEPKNTH